MLKINRIIFLLTAFVFNIFIGVLLNFITPENAITNPFESENIYMLLFGALIAAPIVETFIFQALPFYILTQKKYKVPRFWLYVFVSSIIFGVAHFYSLWYIIRIFFVGIIFASVFYLSKLRREKAIANTIFIHLAHNAFAILMYLIFEDIGN